MPTAIALSALPILDLLALLLCLAVLDPAKERDFVSVAAWHARIGLQADFDNMKVAEVASM